MIWEVGHSKGRRPFLPHPHPRSSRHKEETLSSCTDQEMTHPSSKSDSRASRSSSISSSSISVPSSGSCTSHEITPDHTRSWPASHSAVGLPVQHAGKHVHLLRWRWCGRRQSAGAWGRPVPSPGRDGSVASRQHHLGGESSHRQCRIKSRMSMLWGTGVSVASCGSHLGW